MPERAKTDARTVNGFDVTRLEKRQESLREDPPSGASMFHVAAHWVGHARSRVEDKAGEGVIHLGGKGELSPMDAVLAALAACDVHTIAMHAALLGLPIESLTIEARGRADMRAFLGLEDVRGSGYEEVAYTVRLQAPGATPEQIAKLKEVCEKASPVGDCLLQAIPLKLEFETETSG